MNGDANGANGEGTTSLTFADLETSSVPVYDGETVGEFCERLTGVDGSSSELFWGTTYLPATEVIQALTITKPWQIDLRGGRERLQLRVPAGVAPGKEVLQYMKVKPKLVLEEILPTKSTSSAGGCMQTKRKREDAKSNKSLEKIKKEGATASDAKKQKVIEAEEEERSASPAPYVSTERNFSIDEYDKVQRKMNKSGKKTIKPVARVPKADPSALRLAAPKMNKLKDVIMSNTASVSGKQPMRALTDIYGVSPVAKVAVASRVERNAQTVSRAEDQAEDITAVPMVSEPMSLPDDDLDLAEQLTSLANAAIATTRESPKKRSSQKKMLTGSNITELNKNLTKIAQHLDERYKSGTRSPTNAPSGTKRGASKKSLPGEKPSAHVGPIVVHTGNILDAFRRMKRKTRTPCDMSSIQTNTIGAYYYMTAAGMALQNVTLVPARYIDASTVSIRNPRGKQ